MRHLALSGVFAVILGSATAQKYGGGGGTGVSPTSGGSSSSGGSSGPGGSGDGPGGPGGSGISSITDGICILPEPTTVFVTVTQPAVILPPPTTVTFTVPNSPFGYTSDVSAAPGPQWPSGAPDQTLTVPCTTGPDGRPVPSGPGLVTLTYPAPPGGSPGVGTYSLITVAPSSQTGYPGGPFGVSSSPGGPGGQGLSSNPGWGSFGSSPEPTVTITVPEGTPAGPWESIASTSPEGYGGTYPFPEPTLTLSYHPSPDGNGGGGQGGGGQGGSSYIPTLTLSVPQGPPGGEGGSATGTFTNPYALPTVTVTEPEGGSGGSSVPGGPGGQGATYPFPEPTLTLSYNPPGGGSPGSGGGQGSATVPEGSIGPSNPWPEVTVTIPPNGQPSDTPGGPGGQGWSSTPCDTFGPSNPFPEVTVTVPPSNGQSSDIPGGPGGQGWSSTPGGGFGPSYPFPEVTVTVPPNGQPSDTPAGGFGPSNSLPEITLTLPDTTLTVPYPVPNEPTPYGQGSVPPGGQGWSSTPGGGFGPSNSLPEITVTLPDTTLTIPYTIPSEPTPYGQGSVPPGGPGGQGWSSTPGSGFGPSNSLPEITVTLPDTTLTLPYTIPNEPGSGETTSIPQGGYGGVPPNPTIVVSTVGATPGSGSPGGPGGYGGSGSSASQTFSGGYGWPSPSTGSGGQGQGSVPSLITFTIPNTGAPGIPWSPSGPAGQGYPTSPVVSTLSGTITVTVPSIPWTPIVTPPGFGSVTFSTPCPDELTTPGIPGVPGAITITGGSTTGSSTETPSVLTIRPTSAETTPSAVTIWPIPTEASPYITTIWPGNTARGPSGQGSSSTSCSDELATDVGPVGASSTSSPTSSSTSSSSSSTTSSPTSSSTSSSTSSVASTSTDQVSDAGPVAATSTSSLSSVPTSGWNATTTSSAMPMTGSLDYTMMAVQADTTTQLAASSTVGGYIFGDGPRKRAQLEDRSNVTFNFHDFRPLMPHFLHGTRSAHPVPLLSPYHRFWFSDGIEVVKSQSLGKMVLQYQQPAMVDGTSRSANFSTGPKQATECFAFNLYGMRLGCSSAESECIFTLKGLRFDVGSSTNIEVATQVVHVPASSSSNHKLQHVPVTDFMSLSSVTISLKAEGEDQMWWADDIALGWSDSSWEKASCRAEVPDTIRSRDLMMAGKKWRRWIGM